MDRLVRKINTSPKSKRKTLVQTADNFGVPLKVLLDRDSVKPVPRIVKNICEYLLANGLSSQGIFRINGSAKLIEALKSTFQISAAEDLSSLGNVDIYALAGVLKLFLRELPEGLVSEKQGVKCIKVAKEYASDENMYIFKLQTVLCTLVHENYELLKYLCRFLNKIAENEPVNKMSHNSLGIIFGPCVFRCSLDVQVLKNQGLTNYVMTSLIRHPDSIFVHHPKSDFFVLDRLFKLPEIVSSSALPNLEDRVQSSCDAFPGFGRITGTTPVESSMGNKVLGVLEKLPLTSQNPTESYKPKLDNQIWVSRDCSSSEPEDLQTNTCRVKPDSLYNIALEDKKIFHISPPFCQSVPANQDNEFPVSPPSSSISSPVTFESFNTPTCASPNHSPYYNETADVEESSNSDAEVFFNRTPDQRTLDITNIITSIATCSSPEEFHFQPQSDSCFNTSCRISSYNSKSDYISKIFEKSLYSYDAVSGLPSRRLSESSKFGKSVHSTYDTDNSTELRRISNQQKCTSNEPGVHPINTWNSMPSVQKTTETLLDSMNTSISIKDKTLNQFRLQSPIPESITPNSLECHMNSCDCPSSVDVILQPNVTQNCNSMEREDDLPHLIYLPTPSIDTDHLILEISENDRDLIKPFTNAQPSPGNSQTSLTQAIDHCLDAHMFSFFKQQVSNPVCHSDSVPHSPNDTRHTSTDHRNSVPDYVKPKSYVLDQSKTPLHGSEHFLPNETDNHVVYSTREVKDQQKRSPLSTRHSFDYTTVHTPVRTNSVRECKKYNQSAPASPILLGPTSLPKLRSKSSITEEISKPLKSAIYEPENRRLCTPPLLSHFLDSTVEHKEAALNHQKLSSSERNGMQTSRKIRRQNSLRNRLPTSSRSGDRLNKTYPYVTLMKGPTSTYTTLNHPKPFNNTSTSLELEPTSCLSNKTHKLSAINSEPDLCLKDQSSSRVKPKYASLQQLDNNRISSIKTPSHFKLSTGKKSPITDIDTSEATLFSTRNKPSLGENESSIALHSNSCISAVKLVRSFSLNDTSSIKFRPLLRKFSSTSSKSVLNDICKTSVGDNDGNDNLTLKQSNSTLTSLESFYDLLSAVLSEQRRCCGRPEHLSEMNWDQIEQEKFDIQKGLLYFEGLYGRPKSPKSKRIMKPIYERYRQVKRLVSTRHSCVPGFSSEFPFGRDLSHFKTPIKNPVTGVDNEKWTDNQLPLIVSDDLMKILGIPTRTSEALLEDNIHNMDSDSDLSLSQYVYKCEKSKLPGGSEQRDNKLLKSSDNYNMLTEDNESKKFALKSSHRRSLMRPNDREIQLYYRQIYSLPPLEMYKEKKNILLKKHILQTELIDYENNIQRLLGRKPTKAEREPMRDKFELYSFIKRQLKAVDSRLNFCSSDLINIQGDSNNSVEQ
ncbi:unnamed protein product [Heterobilharzia americana]|nr:unnamed protein product [Heterobilharzia americana]